MSSITSGAVPAPRVAVARPLRPSFSGLLRGEVLKLIRMRTTWICLVVLSGLIFLPYLVSMGAGHRITDAVNGPQAGQLTLLYEELSSNMFVLRFFAAPVVIILTALLFGMEYSGGTIRIMLSRGISRMQFLGVKLVVSAAVALAIAIWGIVLNVVFTMVMLLVVTGNFTLLGAATSDFWQAARVEVIVVVVLLEMMVLLATAITVLGRSSAFGLSAGLAWFFVDNIFGAIFFFLAFRLTGSQGWLLATGDLLSPNLNAMANVFLPASAVHARASFLSTPLTPVTGGHTILIAVIYAVIFVGVAVGLLLKRDVKE